MAISPLAGKLPPADILVDLDSLIAAYHNGTPDPANPKQAVSFGTSGHRGTSLDTSFNDAHIAAITQAICEHRAAAGITGPLFMGKDTHALSAPAEKTALEVLAANGVTVVIQEKDGFTPTPAISLAILMHNSGRAQALADGIVITPSHNPPKDGGFKYNPPNGGPADVDITKAVQARANELLRDGNRAVKRIPFERALSAATTHQKDFARGYVEQLAQIIDFDVIKSSGIKIGIDPLGGASLHYWEPIAARYGIDLEVVNQTFDAQFAFMAVDHDGQIRMDCSSAYAMTPLVALKNRYGIAAGNDTDADRHGIVAPSCGLLNPNHFLAVSIQYLFTHRPQWGAHVGVGKTLVSSCIIDKVAARLGRKLLEVPVGFKWFVNGLFDGSLGFVGEESAGASFLRKDGSVWTTDKDGLIMDLLAAEMTARTGLDPGEQFARITAEFGTPYYSRVDAPATREQKAVLSSLSPENVRETTLAGEPITAKLTRAPGNDAAIGGLKVCTDGGWFAARPSGTEDVYKIYAESLKSREHLDEILTEAKQIVDAALK
ncbi:phosphoglucomutase (alpha-D-glucose-1,6-bisphosphate-dependent) [Oscillatoria laete-virens NRMC-F 0139]|nr:phosphoglucomutase (alpha-D-glucose-1,6-bisphosphate-dependent) [Oscillatoria laete-virens]MDL5052324.1 phosphoglucomutase (alpha-D-glucose-1,6-bisphosphate-dependent) [Oscillatoria laete-virens NRMC-F 0139]